MNAASRTLILGCMLAAAPTIHAQTYPVKPIRLVVGIAPGGGLDASTRIVANKLSEVIGQQVIVENRTGAGGTIAAGAIASSAPDGYNLLYGSTSLMISPAIYPKLTFDPVKSFAPVAGTVVDPLVFAVNTSVSARTTSELIALFKANPGKYSYGSPGVGSVHHLAMETFKKQAGVDVVHVPYKGAAGYVPDLIAGVIPMAVVSVTAAFPQPRAGKIRVIALTSPVKISFAPEWPSVAEHLPGFDMASTQFVVAPAGTPAPIVGRLSGAIKTVISSEDTIRAFEKNGGNPHYVPPEQLAQQIREGISKWGDVARESGAKGE